jgi:hypothetical protein
MWMLPTSVRSGQASKPSVSAVSCPQQRQKCASYAGRVFIGLLSFLPLPMCSGCLGPPIPVRIPEQTKDISGSTDKLDLTFLKDGSTTREVVEKNLAPFDTGTHEPQFFWARWESSTWASAPLLTPYPPFSARVWGPQNILIVFDQSNVVKSWKVLKDKELFEELDRLEQAPEATVGLSLPITLDVELPAGEEFSHRSADLSLSDEFLEYGALKTARSNITKITSTSEDVPQPADINVHPDPDPAHVWVIIHFAQRVGKKKSVTLGLDPRGLLVLRRYARDTNKPTAPRYTISALSPSE